MEKCFPDQDGSSDRSAVAVKALNDCALSTP